MRFHTRCRVVAAAATVLVLALPAVGGAAAPPAGQRPIRETDLLRFVWVADPQISPDGRWVSFVRVTVNAQKDGYDTGLWIADTAGGEPRPLTGGGRDSSPRWSPDGKRLVFTRVPEKGEKKEGAAEEAAGQLYLLSMEGGEARRLTDLPKGAGSPCWSPDGRSIVFTSRANRRDLAKRDGAGGHGREGVQPADRAGRAGEEAREEAPPAAPAGLPGSPVSPMSPVSEPGGGERARDEARAEGAPAADERESDVRVITRAVYRLNGAGYLDPEHPAHLWAIDVPAAAAEPTAPRQLTRGELSEEDPAWSPDGSLLYFLSNRVKEPYYRGEGRVLYAMPARGGEMVKIAAIDGQIANFALDRDGKRIAFEGSLYGHPARSYNQPDLFVVAAAPGSVPRNLTVDYDFDVGGGLTGDQHPPRGDGSALPVWSADGRSVLVRTAERGRANLRRVDVSSGKVEALTAGDQEIVSYSATPDGARLALVASTPLAIGDLYVIEAAAGAQQPMRQLTRFNEPLWAGLSLAAPEEITYKSFDGREIQAWVQKPPGFDPHEQYPLILDIHGGPHAAYGYTFDHEFLWMAAKGYVVLYPNPRGSTSYGQDFGNIIQYRYPGDDFKDLMAGVDELIRRGYVDSQRLGITGGSGGGVLTNWAITQTDRFAAAVSQRSIADWAAWWYTADFTLFQPTWFKGPPFEEHDDFASRSAITHIANVKTPLMLIEGEADYRTPPATGGEQMFRALKYLHKPVVMVRFPGESHELSRSGKPWHRIERLQHIVRWFDKYLQGQKVDLYDVP
jgi:dipeptidyl aminopeptidase/acylaminoacyl peptidase